MLTSDLLHTASRGITVNKSRTALTMLGIIIGVASVVLMVSIGRTFQGYILEQIATIGTAGDAVGIHLVAERTAPDRRFDEAPQRNVREVVLAGLLAGDQGEPAVERVGQCAHRGQRHDVVADAIREEGKWPLGVAKLT